MNPNSLNPFNLHGPAFLAFYIGRMVITLWALKRWLRVFEGRAGTPPPRFDDPYLIAYLRGGVEEAARVATVSLIDRGLLCGREERSASPASPCAR